MAGAPLNGVRIIAVEQFGAGPFGTLHLADLGADVIRVEDPTTGGDVSRYVSPGQQGTDSLYFDSFNRGKRSILLDLKQAAGQEVLRSEEHTSELQSPCNLVCRLLLEKKNNMTKQYC